MTNQFPGDLLHPVSIEGRPDPSVPGRAVEPVDVIFQPEGPVMEGPRHVGHRGSQDDAGVVDGDGRLGGRDHSVLEEDQRFLAGLGVGKKGNLG